MILLRDQILLFSFTVYKMRVIIGTIRLLCFALLGFELRASHLLGKCSGTPTALFALCLNRVLHWGGVVSIHSPSAYTFLVARNKGRHHHMELP
jgi:hypothetical protein